MQQPGDSDLPRFDAERLGYLPYHFRRPHVGVEIFALIAGVAPAEIAFRVFSIRKRPSPE
jgi:hypothetical protein